MVRSHWFGFSLSFRLIRAFIPKANAPKQKIPGIEIVAVERVEEAVIKVR